MNLHAFLTLCGATSLSYSRIRIGVEKLKTCHTKLPCSLTRTRLTLNSDQASLRLIMLRGSRPYVCCIIHTSH